MDATLIEPPSRDGVEGGRASIVSVVVGGVKARPMKWKSPIFAAPGIDIYTIFIKEKHILPSPLPQKDVLTSHV